MNRIETARLLMKQKGHEALITDDPKMLFYFTEMEFSTGTLLISLNEIHFFVDGRYTNQAKPLQSFLSLHTANSSDALEKALKSLPKLASCAFNPFKTTFAKYQHFQSALHHLAPDEELFNAIRRKKEKKELQAIEESCAITEEVMKEAFSFCKKGITEKEFSKKVKQLFLLHGADLAFDPIVAFGKNSACPHWHPTDEPLSDQSLVLLDCGAQFNHYASDMTRVHFLKTPCSKLHEAYTAVKNAFDAASAIARPGVDCAAVDAAARASLHKEGLDQYFTHGLGHGVGLEVHEAPRLRKTAEGTPLLEGDVITIEPGVYLPNIGGIRLENTFVIEKNGARSLMALPTEQVFA